MDSGIINIATCQFAVGADIEYNSKQICSFITKASSIGADIVHFSECALSGYAGIDLDSFEGFNWQLLKEKTEQIITLAGKEQIWVVLGSTHRLTEPNKPYNSLYLISPEGEIVNRYDKRICTNDDMPYYSTGNHFVFFDLNGVKCALLICFELRFPEFYRIMCKEGVQCIFQSFYNARQYGPSVHSDIMQQSMQCRAATNYFWVSMTNSSAYYSPYESCLIQPDGKIVEKLELNKEGIMVNTVDVNRSFYDPSKDFRFSIIDGALSNGPKINDPRSKDTTCY